MGFGLKDKDERVRTYTSGGLFNLVKDYVEYYNILEGKKLELIDVFSTTGLIIINFGGNSVTKNDIILFKLKKIMNKLNE